MSRYLLVVSSGSPTKILYAFILIPIHATSPAHLIHLVLIILIILGEEYKLWSSSLCSFRQPPGQIFSASCSQTHSVYVPCERPVSHPYKTTGKCYATVFSSLTYCDI
jgi:xanthosine utilization system XapX-like protein